MPETRSQLAETGGSARERILDASYEPFSKRGIRAVGVHEVAERAGVATATLYRHFSSKDDLVLAFLQLREQRWTKDFVEAGAMGRGSDPEQRLLAIFDVFDEWFQREGRQVDGAPAHRGAPLGRIHCARL
jgi:AcrR family transcriptional regulator